MSRFHSAAAGFALALAAGTASADTWSVTLAPSMTAPRLGDLNAALRDEGLASSAQAVGAVGAGSGMRQTGFDRARWQFGADLGLAYEFNEDLRGGLQFGFCLVPTSDSISLTDTSTRISGTMTITSATAYTATERVSLPLARIGLFVQRTFRFEDSPEFMLYLGGWGSVGTLAGASLSGDLTQFGTNLKSSYHIALSGQGWGGGALGGAEYAVTPLLSLVLESGFDAFWIATVDSRASLTKPSGTSTGKTIPLLNGANRGIGLDFSGVFVRIGLRATFRTPS